MDATKPVCNKQEFARRGEAIYKQVIEPVIKSQDAGKFVAIDIETGQYELDADETAASDRLLSRLPKAQTWLRKIGSPYIRRFGHSGSERS
jgi:hypothetical protein